MKTFSAKDFSKKPAEVYRAADREGSVRINNGQYKDRIFILTAKERGIDLGEDPVTEIDKT